MIKALKDARWNYLWVFLVVSMIFAQFGTYGYFNWSLWIVALAMVIESFVLAMELAENEDAK